MAARLRAVIFDVDGTLAFTERHGHRVAFNQAFERAGLPDRWDEDLYGELLKVTGGKRRIAHYFVTRAGMAQAEADELAARLHADKTAIFTEVAAAGQIPPRPGLGEFLDALAAAGIRLAVATTGRRAWVEPLLAQLLKGSAASFEDVVCGDDVATLKPAPDAYLLSLERLRVAREEAVAVEDSRNGIRSAHGAGLAVLGVAGDYGGPEALDEADLAIDGLASPRVLRDPGNLVADGAFGVETVVRLSAIARAG